MRPVNSAYSHLWILYRDHKQMCSFGKSAGMLFSLFHFLEGFFIKGHILDFSVLLHECFISFNRTGIKVWHQTEHRILVYDVMSIPPFFRFLVSYRTIRTESMLELTVRSAGCECLPD